MSKSNLFAITEVTKVVAGLREYEGDFRAGLLSQAAYLLIIDPKHFSDTLRKSWMSIQDQLTQQGPLLAADGSVVLNRVVHTIRYLTDAQCMDLVGRLITLQTHLQEECEKVVLA